MRILHWLNAFLPDIGGIETFCAQLIPEQLDRGHEVLLLAAHGPTPLPDHTTYGGIDVRRVDSMKAVMDRDPGRILRARAEIERVISDFDPDVIHFHPCGPETMHFIQVDRRRHRPTVATVHNTYALAGLDPARGTFGDTLTAVERIATVSDDSRRWILTARPELAERVSIVRNGIPVDVATPTPLSWDPPRLVAIGRIAPEKRTDLLLEAFAVVVQTHPDVRMSIAGGGLAAHEAELVSHVDRLGLADRVDVLGKIEPSAVPALFAESTIHVMSSDREGLPIVLLEAARQGRPSVVTDAGGCPEFVVDGETGLVVERGDHVALAAAVTSLLDDRDRTAQMGTNASRRFRAEFSLGACADAYDALYATALEVANASGRGSAAP